MFKSKNSSVINKGMELVSYPRLVTLLQSITLLICSILLHERGNSRTSFQCRDR